MLRNSETGLYKDGFEATANSLAKPCTMSQHHNAIILKLANNRTK